MVAWSHGRVCDLLPSGLTPFQVGRPMSRDRTIDLPTWNGAYRRLRPCTGSTAAVSTAAGRGLFRPIGTELPPVGNRITTVRSLQSPVSSLSWTADCMLPTAYWPSAHPAPKVVLCGCQQQC